MTIISDIAHLYRRAGFGASPAQLDAGASAGYDATVEGLLAGLGAAPDPAGDAVAVPTFAPYPAHRAGTRGSPAARAAAKALEHTWHEELVALQDWWLDRMIVTSTPLREKLTLLWHGHFATAISKVRDPHLMYLQNQLFRTAGAGSFEALVQAVAKDGAMMFWLDTRTDVVAHPNENFARECMELFTLGVGTYTQSDVEEVARCFTGWAYDRHDDRWVLRAAEHDDGTKTFLGRTGDFGGEDAVSIIVAQPDSARFVAAGLWSHLAYPVTPADRLIDDLVPAYGLGYDLTGLLRAVFLHPGFRSTTARTGLVKQPVEYLVGAARALGLDSSGHPAGTTTPTAGTAGTTPESGMTPASGATRSKVGRLATLATTLAQTPFDPTNVGGWGQNTYWLDTATSQARLRAAALMATRADLGAVEQVAPSQRLAATARLLGLVDGFSAPTARALAPLTGQPRALVTLALNSPDYVLD